MLMLKDSVEAYNLLKTLGAPDRLVRHGEVVAQAAESLLSEFQSLGIACDANIRAWVSS